MSLPVGSIIIWNKPSAEIPQGWQVCDGSNGTPDLRDYFVMGATIESDVGDGGDGSHSHTRPSASSSDGAHTHVMRVSVGGVTSGIQNGTNDNQYGVTTATANHNHGSSGNQQTGSGGGHSHTITGNTNTETVDPEHVKLYYIMRVT